MLSVEAVIKRNNEEIEKMECELMDFIIKSLTDIKELRQQNKELQE